MSSFYENRENNSASRKDVVISYDSEGLPYSRYGDDKWFVSEFDHLVQFNNLSGMFKRVVKSVVYDILQNPMLTSVKSVLNNVICGAVIFEKMIKECGGIDYTFLEDDSGFRRVIERGRLKNLRYKTWMNNIVFLSRLGQGGYIRKDIENSVVLAKYLAGDTTFTRQTMAIPENIASAYFGNAISVVEKYYPHRKNISDLYGIFLKEYYANKSSGFHTITCKRAALKKASSFELYEIELDLTGRWLSWLRGACYTVLAAFTGCRDGEIKSFNLSSYEERAYASIKIPILNGIDTKPNVGGVKRAVSWVTIPVASKAIELLWDAYEFARHMWLVEADRILHADEKERFVKGVNSLFITIPFSSSTKPVAGRQPIVSSLENFSRSVGYKSTSKDVEEFNLLNPTRTGELKVDEVLIPHPHAFRRTFAVYVVRNRLGSLLDLKYQFKHMNIAMTSWYSNQANVASYFDMQMDKELLAEISVENDIYIRDTLFYLYNEAETLAGPEGQRILELREKSPTTIYLSRKEISQQVEEGRLSIIEHPGGHCTNPKCDRVCDMTTCQYKVVTKEKALELVSVRERLIEKYRSLDQAKVNQPNILSKIYYEIRSIEKIFDEHEMDHDKISASISVSLL